MQDWFERNIWGFDRSSCSVVVRSVFAVVRVVYLSFLHAAHHQLFLRASALTLFFLLAVVPMLATIFGIATGFGLAELVESRIREAFSSQAEVTTLLVEFSKRSLEHAKGGIIAGIGVILLFWTVIRMFTNMEAALNVIWDVSAQRPWIRRLTDYLFLLVLFPLLLVFSSSGAVALSSYGFEFLIRIGVPQEMASVILVAAQFAPALLLAAGFSFLYAFLPNTHVRLGAAVVGGTLTALFTLLAQWLYLQVQFALSSYGAIYGSFAALPLFLLYVQSAWVLILYGAELARSVELVDEYEFAPGERRISHERLFEGITSIGNALWGLLKENKPLVTSYELAQMSNLSVPLVRFTISQLKRAGLVTEDENKRIVPLISTERLHAPHLQDLFLQAKVLPVGEE